MTHFSQKFLLSQGRLQGLRGGPQPCTMSGRGAGLQQGGQVQRNAMCQQLGVGYCDPHCSALWEDWRGGKGDEAYGTTMVGSSGFFNFVHSFLQVEDWRRPCFRCYMLGVQIGWNRENDKSKYEESSPRVSLVRCCGFQISIFIKAASVAICHKYVDEKHAFYRTQVYLGSDLWVCLSLTE